MAIGTGQLLARESYQKMITRDLIGKTTAVEGCPTCFTQSVGYCYGLGIVTSGNWLMQNPLLRQGLEEACEMPSLMEV